MKKIFFLIIVIFCLLRNAAGQTFLPEGVTCLRASAIEEGKRFEDKRYFKFFALLLQDTCSASNRFTNYFYSSDSSKSNQPEKYYKAIIINSAQAVLAEKSFKNLTTDLSRYIRLYVGFLSNENDTCLVVQFLTLKEYKNDKFYSKQMNLLAQKKNLRFAILTKKENEFRVEGYFPNDFFKKQ